MTRSTSVPGKDISAPGFLGRCLEICSNNCLHLRTSKLGIVAMQLEPSRFIRVGGHPCNDFNGGGKIPSSAPTTYVFSCVKLQCPGQQKQHSKMVKG